MNQPPLKPVTSNQTLGAVASPMKNDDNYCWYSGRFPPNALEKWGHSVSLFNNSHHSNEVFEILFSVECLA